MDYMSERVRKYIKHNESELWAVVSADKLRGVHVWRMSCGEGGVEFHESCGPNEGRPCWLLGRNCKHDGSTLAYREDWAYRLRDLDSGAISQANVFSLLEKLLEENK
jgi:hypothetical protein